MPNLTVPRVWNALTQVLRESESSSAFRRKLDTHLFSDQRLHHHPSLRMLFFFSVCVPFTPESKVPIRSEQCQNTKFFRSRHWK